MHNIGPHSRTINTAWNNRMYALLAFCQSPHISISDSIIIMFWKQTEYSYVYVLFIYIYMVVSVKLYLKYVFSLQNTLFIW